MSAVFNDVLQSVCKNDDHFKAAVSKLRACMPNITDEDLFTLPKPLFENSISPQLVTRGLVLVLLDLHYTPCHLRSPKNLGSNFIGNRSKRRGAVEHCVYFPRDHVVTLFRLVFDYQDFTHKMLESIWKFLHKEKSKCKTYESKEFFSDEPFSFPSFIDGCKQSRPVKRRARSKPSADVDQSFPAGAVSKSVSKRRKTHFECKGVQTRFRLDNSKVLLSNSRPRPSVRLSKISLSLKTCQSELKVLKSKSSLLIAENQVLECKIRDLLNDKENLTRRLADSIHSVDSLSDKLKESKKREHQLIDNCKYLDNELAEYRELNGKVDSLSEDPDFKANVAKVAKDYSSLNTPTDCPEASKSSMYKAIPMRTSRKNINPSIVLAITILRMIGNCSLEKTMQTLVLLGNLVFGQNWVLGSDVSNTKARHRSIVPETTDPTSDSSGANNNINAENDTLTLVPSSDTIAAKPKRVMHQITAQTCPVQSYVRKIEKCDLNPLALQSVAQELKDPNLVTSTLMYDGCSIKKGKSLTMGLVNAVKDPDSGRVTSHLRTIGIQSMVSTDAHSTFKAVASRMRDISVLDSKSSNSCDVRESVKDSFSKIDFVVADAGSEMKPTANKLSEFKRSLGHSKGLEYIHCNAHVSPAFDSAIDQQLREVEKMLELKDHVSRTFNSTFFKVSVSNTCTMLHAMFRMLGTAVDSNQTWSCLKDFNIYLESIQVTDKDTFFDPNISRFGKESEMCFILTYNFDHVSDFLGSVLRENRVFKACSLYIKCPYFREILTSVSLLFYHIYSPFLVAVGAETMFGHRVLTHSQLYSYYPKLKEDLESLTIDPTPLLSQTRLPHLSQFQQLTDIRKQVYKRMADGIFANLENLVENDDLKVDVMKGILTLICEQLLIVIHRQVEDYYGGPESVIGKTLASNPDILDKVPITSLACEHSVGMLRQSHRRAPTSNMQSLAQFQIIKKSVFFDRLISRKISPDQLGQMIKSARKSKSFKLFHQHQKDDKARYHQECVIELDNLKKNRKKIIKDKAELTDLVKNHGGPCRTSEDVDNLVKNHSRDPKLLMVLLWREIKFQKVVIYCDFHNQRFNDLFKKQRMIKSTGKYEQVPLDERIQNLKTILNGSSADGDELALPVVHVDTFMERVAAKHKQMKQCKHRLRAEPEPEVQFCYLSNDFYADLPNMKHIAVYYDDDHEAQKWYPGSIEKVNASENCRKCKDFALPECNDDFQYCFDVRFMDIMKDKNRLAKKGNGSGSNLKWAFCNDTIYHVTVCQIIACKVQLRPLGEITVGSISSKKKSARANESYVVENAADIDEFLKCNVLYMLKNTDNDS